MAAGRRRGERAAGAAHARHQRAELARPGHRTFFKPLTPLLFHLGETREFTEGLATGETLELAIFQQRVERGVDLRLFVVGDRVVPAAVRSRHEELIDWRVDPDTGRSPPRSPPSLAGQLLPDAGRAPADPTARLTAASSTGRHSRC
nr:hypothetical protein GCM10020063_061630 [Dactylosporangium thailandense]